MLDPKDLQEVPEPDPAAPVDEAVPSDETEATAAPPDDSPDRYVLNSNPRGPDTLHCNPREECNLDDAKGRQNIDALSADALLTLDEVRPCEHCWPET